MGLHNQVICLPPITANRTYSSYREQINFDEQKLYNLWVTCWFLLRSTDTDKEVPTWGAYNSLICDQSTITLTKHCVLPLLHGSLTDWSTLYSALKIRQGITKLVTPSQKAVTSLDLQFYINNVST